VLDFDDDGARTIDRTYASADLVGQRARTLELLDPRPGERVLDIGSGPGYLAAALAERVGRTGAVCAVDPSPAMNTIAEQRTAALPQVTVDVGDALALPHPDGGFDAAVCTQVYEYVADMPAALAELRRVLRPGGRVLVLDTDWDSMVWHVTDRALHARVVAAWEEHLVDARLPRVLGGLLRQAGFAVTGVHVVPLLAVGYGPDTYAAHTEGTVAAFVTGRQGLTVGEVAAWRADLAARTAAGEGFFSLNRYVFLAERG
jgi:SAM-dependent methyltransferase